MSTAQQSLRDFRELPVEEKVAVAEQLWGELEAQLDGVPPTAAEVSFLKERLAAIGSDSRPDVDWGDVRAALLRRP